MKNKKKDKVPSISTHNLKVGLLLILILLVISRILFGLKDNFKTIKPIEEIRYFTGEVFSYNQSANLIDKIDTNSNIVISPLNINNSIAIIYNGVDNNSKKEIKNYFKKEPSEINEILKEKNNSLTYTNYNNKQEIELYKSIIEQIYNNKFNELSVQDINKLKDEDKHNLLLLLRKADITYNMMNKNNNHTVKTINAYTLSKEELNLSTYEINNLLEKVLDQYETFEIQNIIINKNNLYYQNITLNKDYNKIIKDTYNEPIHINENTNINSDIKEYTEEKIKRVVEEDDYSSDIILINTLYFNYKWKNNISANYVSSGTFKLYDNNETIVEYMYDEVSEYMENDYAVAFKKDFENSDYTFIGIVPKNTGDFDISNLDLDNLIKNPKKGKVSISIPKFEVESTIDLTELLPKFGIKTIFNKDANLTIMTNDTSKIDIMKQKIYINIGEKGTTTTSSKNTTIHAYEVDTEDKQIYLNRPFAYLIINNKTNDVLFIGKVVNP